MRFMICACCGGSVTINATGTCLGCQRGFIGLPQEDAWINSPEREKAKLEKRKEEIEDAFQEQKAKRLPVRKQAGRRNRVREENTQGKDTSFKGEKKEAKEKVGNL